MSGTDGVPEGADARGRCALFGEEVRSGEFGGAGGEWCVTDWAAWGVLFKGLSMACLVWLFGVLELTLDSLVLFI